jgi:hypothetical protein
VLVEAMRVMWARSIEEEHRGASLMIALACAEKAAPYMHSKLGVIDEKARLQAGANIRVLVQRLTHPRGEINLDLVADEQVIEGEAVEVPGFELSPDPQAMERVLDEVEADLTARTATQQPLTGAKKAKLDLDKIRARAKAKTEANRQATAEQRRQAQQRAQAAA